MPRASGFGIIASLGLFFKINARGFFLKLALFIRSGLKDDRFDLKISCDKCLFNGFYCIKLGSPMTFITFFAVFYALFLMSLTSSSSITLLYLLRSKSSYVIKAEF